MSEDNVISEEYMELGPVGEIDEKDLTILNADFQSMVVAPTDWTIGVFADLLRRNKIDLSPNYQRRIAWTEDKMSKFIESLFLRLPVPQVVLAETLPGRFAIIDGKQRVNSLARFCNDRINPLKLKGCEYLKELNSNTYEQLSSEPKFEAAVDAFESHTIRTTVIKSIPNKEVLYLLFLRLNQNSVPLSPQELRRALTPGDFLNWLDEKTANSKGMKVIFGKTPDFRMRDMEIATRHFGFKLFAHQYSGNMKQFLDLTTRILTDEWKNRNAEMEMIWREYEAAIEFSYNIFQKDVFKVFADDGYQSSKNRAVMDIMTHYFSFEHVRAQSQDHPAIKAAFEALCANNSQFLSFLQLTTKSTPATSGRFHLWGEAIQKVNGQNVPVFPLPFPI
ncbi:DUF262 domain-containing protein [Azospirillum brasilense]|uniref:DUF262 domain-containing protein n=1 Tax=Azospirillum brasilense TaxID=192 RepID=UPI000E68B206|nr:DUF262 domain-containing protein [Azospirillum brasilense]NUB28829.1 DUF262 domain-containing protein [Azospirillum brasilense]NUB35818.1 DUF262 domain-containing protein [Azospirillum brasilense]RIW03152.1 DUF262 domain-containing protein [Azospirillum brasilense]